MTFLQNNKERIQFTVSILVTLIILIGIPFTVYHTYQGHKKAEQSVVNTIVIYCSIFPEDASDVCKQLRSS